MVSPTFKQLQSVKSYYGFPDSLDVDRYSIDGKLNDTVIAVRELDLEGVPANQRNWINDHTVYTHGFGVVAAYGNRRGEDGQPVFYEQNIPPVGKLGTFEPRIYFGEKSPEYSIVGGATGSRPGSSTTRTAARPGRATTCMPGDGGVQLGSFARKVAYAIKYRELKFLLSDAVNDRSRLLYIRQPLDRVKKVAPWLTLDGNPYPAVVGGRIQWIVDGYTTSATTRTRACRTSTTRPRTRSLRPRARCARSAPPGQLHPQLGEGHRRRVRRHGAALPRGTPRTRCSRPGPRRSMAPCGR